MKILTYLLLKIFRNKIAIMDKEGNTGKVISVELDKKYIVLYIEL